MEFNHFKYIIVGAGFFGAVIAERIASVLGEPVLILDSRPHIGGNSYSSLDTHTGIEVHHYGSHIFHTQDKDVWDYINRFTTFNNYRHKVVSSFKNIIYPMPINLETINKFYQCNLRPYEVEDFLKKEIAQETNLTPHNLEDKAISLIGRKLYEAFILGYTHKQWGTDPRMLPASIITRLPVRHNYNADYFDDCYQGIPVHGYGKIFENMLRHDKIAVLLNIDFFSLRHLLTRDKVIIYSGPLDRFFDYNCGELGWRTLNFQSEVVRCDDFQGTAVVNYADKEIPYTRIHEFKHYTNIAKNKNNGNDSIIYYEYSKLAQKKDQPYYPINTDGDKKILQQYQEQMKQFPHVIFGGRLGSYRYMDMHQVIASALSTFQNKILHKPCT